MTRILTALLILGVGLPATLVADKIPGSTTPVDALVADLTWNFSVSQESTTSTSPVVEATVWRFKSAEPVERSKEGNVYLRFSLAVHQFRETEPADDLVAEWAQKDQKFFGLTKAWARIYQRGSILYRLDMPCLLSADHVDAITSRLTAVLPREPGEYPAIYCRCGAGCAAGQWSPEGGFRSDL